MYEGDDLNRLEPRTPEGVDERQLVVERDRIRTAYPFELEAPTRADLYDLDAFGKHRLLLLPEDPFSVVDANDNGSTLIEARVIGRRKIEDSGIGIQLV